MRRVAHVFLVDVPLGDGWPVHGLVGLLERPALVGDVRAEVATVFRGHNGDG